MSDTTENTEKTKYANLDSINVNLDGTKVIEAAAGTGKTYNIQNLYTRLLLEKGNSIEEVVVVTFTKAATAELKTRIRQVLMDVEAVLKGKTTANDLQRDTNLVEAIKQTNVTDEQLKERLQVALLCFDQAQIYTIDGFCARLQKEYALDAGVRFAVNIVSEHNDKIEEICGIFDRTQRYKFAHQNLLDVFNKHCPHNSNENVLSKLTSIAQKKISDLKERVRIVNETPGAILVSIHQNHFSDSRYSGAQVFSPRTQGS